MVLTIIIAMSGNKFTGRQNQQGGDDQKADDKPKQRFEIGCLCHDTSHILVNPKMIKRFR